MKMQHGDLKKLIVCCAFVSLNWQYVAPHQSSCRTQLLSYSSMYPRPHIMPECQAPSTLTCWLAAQPNYSQRFVLYMCYHHHQQNGHQSVDDGDAYCVTFDPCGV